MLPLSALSSDPGCLVSANTSFYLSTLLLARKQSCKDAAQTQRGSKGELGCTAAEAGGEREQKPACDSLSTSLSFTMTKRRKKSCTRMHERGKDCQWCNGGSAAGGRESAKAANSPYPCQEPVGEISDLSHTQIQHEGKGETVDRLWNRISLLSQAAEGNRQAGMKGHILCTLLHVGTRLLSHSIRHHPSQASEQKGRRRRAIKQTNVVVFFLSSKKSLWMLFPFL